MVDDFSFEDTTEIHHVVGNSNYVTNAASVFNSGKATATTESIGLGSSLFLRPDLKGDPDYIVSLFFQDSSGGGGIYTAAHGNKNLHLLDFEHTVDGFAGALGDLNWNFYLVNHVFEGPQNLLQVNELHVGADRQGRGGIKHLLGIFLS